MGGRTLIGDWSFHIRVEDRTASRGRRQRLRFTGQFNHLGDLAV